MAIFRKVPLDEDSHGLSKDIMLAFVGNQMLISFDKR
jgi:hypothetical protein